MYYGARVLDKIQPHIGRPKYKTVAENAKLLAKTGKMTKTS
jgi:hypothetical protein